jgi:hypothetical protein
VSAPWTSTWVMDLSVGREWFVRFEGAVCRDSGAAQAAEPTWPSLVFAYGDAVVWEKKMHVKCLFLHTIVSAGQIAKSLSGQLT